MNPARLVLTINPDEMISAKAAAAVIQVKPATLTAWRNQKRGPAYLKVGRLVFYRRQDIGEWLAAQRHCMVAA
jgi:predicted DNA-binding transcriptional regulator AlpA